MTRRGHNAAGRRARRGSSDVTRIPARVDPKKIPKSFQCPPAGQTKQWPCRVVGKSGPKGRVLLMVPQEPGTTFYGEERTSRGRLREGWWFQPKGLTKAGTPKAASPREPLTMDQLRAIQFAASLKGSPEKKALELLRQNALFVVNLSGGKDSQAMWLHLTQDLKIPLENIYAIHADLPGADWPRIKFPSGRIAPSVVEHMRGTTDAPIEIVVARWGSTGEIKTFDSLVRHAGEVKGVEHPFPSPANRQCTSDLKTGVIGSASLTKLCELNGLEVRKGGGCGSVEGFPWRIVVMCLGIRSAESTNREQDSPWRLSLEASKQGRAWFRWYPIFDWSKEEVFDEISRYGQEPFWTYGMTPEHMDMIREKAPTATRGMERLSCQFCILGSQNDLWLAAQLAPQAYARRCALEEQFDSAMSMTGKKLPELTGIVPIESLRRRSNPWEGLEVNPWADMVFNPHDVELAQVLLGSRPQTAKRLRNRLLR